MMTKNLSILAALGCATLLASCSPNPENRELEYMPDMYRNPALKAQESYDFFRDGSAMRMPVANTVATNEYIYPYSITEGERAGAELQNPVPLNEHTLRQGQKYFNIHCKVCHGVVGSGDGLVTQIHVEGGMPVPPSLYGNSRTWRDGQLYHTITMGQGQMPAYGSRIEPQERWAIVHYIRALQIAAAPTEEDVQAATARGYDNPEKIEQADDPYAPNRQNPQLYLDADAQMDQVHVPDEAH